MKLILSILCCSLLTLTNVLAQKLYVWSPKEPLTNPRPNFLSKDSIDIVFPDGKWNAVTAYSVKIYDYRNNKELKSIREIQKVASKSNTGGYRTAKNILNTTYTEANQKLLFFIDETFMK